MTSHSFYFPWDTATAADRVVARTLAKLLSSVFGTQIVAGRVLCIANMSGSGRMRTCDACYG